MLLQSLIISLSLQMTAEAAPPVSGLMHRFLALVVGLQPYAATEKTFRDPKNDKIIREYFKGLNETTKQIKHFQELQPIGFRISGDALKDHVNEMEQAFRSGKKSYARMMLQATLEGCGSCHTQITDKKNMEWDLDKVLPQSVRGFDRAEFLFSARQWDKAADLYADLIAHFPGNKAKIVMIEKSIKRLMAYYLRLKRDPKAALDQLKRVQTNTRLPKRIRVDVNDWISVIKLLSLQNIPDLKKVRASELEAFAEHLLEPADGDSFQTFSETQYATFLFVSGFLYEFVNTHSEKDMSPGILYWLAICDEWLHQEFFFSMADLYLKECIKRYPASKTAKEQCFPELKERIELAYTGSAGKDIPPEVQAEIDAFRKLLKE